jgi:hypothetical protein
MNMSTGLPSALLEVRKNANDVDWCSQEEKGKEVGLVLKTRAEE